MKLKHVTVAVAGIGLMFTACQKEQPIPGSKTAKQPNGTLKTTDLMAPFFATNRENNTQTFTVSAGTGGTLTLASGSQLIIAPSAFRNPNGGVTQGNVTIEVNEMYKRSELLANNFPTESALNSDGSGGGPIATGGSFTFRMRNASGADVTAPVGNVLAQIKGSLTGGISTDMEMWSGVVSTDQSRDNAWQNLGSAPVIIGGTTYQFPVTARTTANIDSYQDWLNWINGAIVRVTLPTGLDDSNTEVYMTYKNRPGILTSLDKFVPATASSAAYWTEDNTYLDAGQEGSIIVVSMKDGSLKANIQSYTLVTGQTEHVTSVSATTLSDLKIAVDALP
jgi:type IV secretory pathway VirB2 component (pilin)